MLIVFDPEHPQAHQPRRPDGRVSLSFWEPGGLRNALPVVTKHDHRRFGACLLTVLLGSLRGTVVGRLGRVLGGFFALWNDEGGRSPLVRSAVLAGWSLLTRRWGLFRTWLLHRNSSL